MEQFLIELFTLFFVVSDSPLLILLIPILAPILTLGLMVGVISRLCLFRVFFLLWISICNRVGGFSLA